MAYMFFVPPPAPNIRRNPKHGSSCYCVDCGTADRLWEEWRRRCEEQRKACDAFNESQSRKMAKIEKAHARPRSLLDRIFG